MIDPKARLRTGPKGIAPGGIAAGALSAGGGLVAVETVIITSIQGHYFNCQRLDANGDPLGDDLAVYALSYPAIDGLLGEQPLEDCDPQRAIGEYLRIEWRNQFLGQSGSEPIFREGYWALQEFTLFACECQEA